MTSSVSIVSDIVANGHQLILTFPAPPLKFRTVGFPQYGFKRKIPLRPSPVDLEIKRMTRIPSIPTNLYAASCPPIPSPVALCLQVLQGGLFRPEALGSPAGYVVPPGLRLLRPHEPLSASPPGLSVSSRRVFVLRSDRDRPREVPQFTPRVSPTVPSSVPRHSDGAPTVSSPSPLAFTLSLGARHLQNLPRRSSMGIHCSRGCDVRFMLQPGELLALHRQELLLSSFHPPGSPPSVVEDNYPAKQSIAGAGLSPARHAALWAANGEINACFGGANLPLLRASLGPPIPRCLNFFIASGDIGGFALDSFGRIPPPPLFQRGQYFLRTSAEKI
jgi:hypothetical protein